jgi:branched-chain amino acid aminotransferase
MKHIQEVGRMNVFFVIDGEVVTPATDGAILKGITRKLFMDILRDKGIPVSERVITIDEVVEADRKGSLQEIFGAGTAAVVSHVAELQYRDHTMTLPPVGERKIGPMLKEYIDGLRVGTVEDTHGWLLRV